MCKSKIFKYPPLLSIFLFFYLLNYLMPMAFGDDYLYAFKWQGNPMFVPLTDDAAKIASLKDLFESQVSFYFTWSGRIVNNTLAQLFAWAGKTIFNICNAAVMTLLVVELYWCINKGKVATDFKKGLLCWIVFVFWTFTPRFPSVALWMVGAFHYLWPAVLLTGFLLPYIRKYYCLRKSIAPNNWFSVVMFFGGIFAGCTNENSGCWIILALVLFLFVNKKEKVTETWMYTGMAGFVLGYILLMAAPGNYARLISVHGNNWFGGEVLWNNFQNFLRTIIWQFVLWYFCLRSLVTLGHLASECKTQKAGKLLRDMLLVKVLCVLAMGMSAIMIVSPEFHLRSAFPGTVQLIIAAGIIVRAQQEYGTELLPLQVKRFLTCVGVIYFAVTSIVTSHHHFEQSLHLNNILSSVKIMQALTKENQTVLNVEPFPETGKTEDFLSGFHTFENNLSKDENSWENVAFARYYGIKGIRTIRDEK